MHSSNLNNKEAGGAQNRIGNWNGDDQPIMRIMGLQSNAATCSVMVPHLPIKSPSRRF